MVKQDIFCLLSAYCEIGADNFQSQTQTSPILLTAIITRSVKNPCPIDVSVSPFRELTSNNSPDFYVSCTLLTKSVT